MEMTDIQNGPTEPRDRRAYGKSVASRVDPDEQEDPLYSGRHLRVLEEYLIQNPSSNDLCSEHPFVYVYNLDGSGPPKPVAYNNVLAFERSLSKSKHEKEIVFLAGQPSAEWLNSIGSLYDLDPEILFRHMRFLRSADGESYLGSSISSATANTMRLCIPTIVSIFPEHRHVKRDDLYSARIAIDEKLRKQFNKLKTAPHSEAGIPFFRRINIHRGDLMTVEQEVTISIVDHADNLCSKDVRQSPAPATQTTGGFTILIWTDSNGDGSLAQVPLPNTPRFFEASIQTSFHPVVLDRSHVTTSARTLEKVNMREGKQSQTLSFLACHYGLDLDNELAVVDPFSATIGLFRFMACAVSQFLNMLSMIIDLQLEQFRIPPDTDFELPDAMTFHYSLTVLERCRSQLDDAVEYLETKGGPSWAARDLIPRESALQLKASLPIDVLLRDFRTLSRKVDHLVLKCNQGLQVVRDLDAVNEARQANEQTDAVTTLTRITTLVTVVYVPLSFVTSIFGMNFRQFGQGNLSLWWWGALSGPLFLISVLFLTWLSPWMRALARDGTITIQQFCG